jgi:hypothetical protein
LIDEGELSFSTYLLPWSELWFFIEILFFFNSYFYCGFHLEIIVAQSCELNIYILLINNTILSSRVSYFFNSMGGMFPEKILFEIFSADNNI